MLGEEELGLCEVNTDDGEAVIRKPLRGRAAALQDVSVDEFSEKRQMSSLSPRHSNV